MEKQKQIRSISGIKALAFLGVVSAHSGLTGSAIYVSIFFIVSGFLMTYSYYGRELKTGLKDNLSFAVKKMRMLYPLHIICLLIIAVSIGIIGKSPALWKYVGKTFVIDALLIQSWFPDTKINMSLNGVSWYLSTALFLYYAFPWLLKGIKKYHSRKQAVLVSAAIFAMMFAAAAAANRLVDDKDAVKWATYVFPVFRLGDFAIGANFGYVFLNSKRKLPEKEYTALEILSLILIAADFYFDLNGDHFGLNSFIGMEHTLMHIIPAVVFIYICAHDGGKVSAVLGSRPLKVLGDLSAYGFLTHYLFTYLAAPQILRILDRVGLEKGQTVISFIIILFFTLLTAQIYNKAYHRIASRVHR